MNYLAAQVLARTRSKKEFTRRATQQQLRYPAEVTEEQAKPDLAERFDLRPGREVSVLAEAIGRQPNP
jgi:hypothetical protein